MQQTPLSQSQHALVLDAPEKTTALGETLARQARIGDVYLLDGPIGAGKSHLARAFLRELMRQGGGAVEDIPSPTFTLVQTYDTALGEIWHADLYRLSNTLDVMELGLYDAFEDAVCLIEWPDRLGDDAPKNALTLSLQALEETEGRLVTLTSSEPEWAHRIGDILGHMNDTLT